MELMLSNFRPAAEATLAMELTLRWQATLARSPAMGQLVVERTGGGAGGKRARTDGRFSPTLVGTPPSTSRLAHPAVLLGSRKSRRIGKGEGGKEKGQIQRVPQLKSPQIKFTRPQQNTIT